MKGNGPTAVFIVIGFGLATLIWFGSTLPAIRECQASGGSFNYCLRLVQR